MGLTPHLLASGPGWRVVDARCTSSRHDRPFEERHEGMCIAAVTAGNFRYRTTQGEAVLAPGAVLLGNHQHGFECDHAHSDGDRCIAFHFAPDYLETIVAAVPGARRVGFSVPRLPPLQPLVAILAAAEAARDDGDADALEELAMRLAGAVAAALVNARGPERAPSRHDERRVAAALHRIERDAHARLPLAELARDSASSPYHFLRVFQQVVGMTPHQFVLRTRLHRAAVRLRRSDERITTIALDAGFNDVSTFNRRFRRVMGVRPSAYRASGRA
ncbi:MAG TPA: AraC family transcriptional regulator [Gemmatimonadaceae bacterium]|nr:AraC family transcriptional regulator [Gemmatimonadaceae bacterium]